MNVIVFFFFKQKTAYEILAWLEFRRVLFRSLWLPLDGTLIHRRLAPSRCWYSFTYPGRKESWVGLGGKEGCTNDRISANQGSNREPCGRNTEILPTAPTCPLKCGRERSFAEIKQSSCLQCLFFLSKLGVDIVHHTHLAFFAWVSPKLFSFYMYLLIFTTKRLGSLKFEDYSF